MQRQSRGKKWGRGVGLKKPASPPITNMDTKKCDMDIYTAASVPSAQSRPAGLCPHSLVAGSSIHPPTTRPLVPPVGTIWPALAADLACTSLIRYGPGTPLPFIYPQPSPCGPDRNLAMDQVHLDFPTLTGPLEATQLPDPPAAHPHHCPISKYSTANSFSASFFGNSPLGITCANTTPPTKAPLIYMGSRPFEQGSVRGTHVFEQTRVSIVATLKSAGVYTDDSSSSGCPSPLEGPSLLTVPTAAAIISPSSASKSTLHCEVIIPSCALRSPCWLRMLCCLQT